MIPKSSLSLAVLLLGGLPVSAGTFSYSPFSGDADSTITLDYTYTAKADFNGSGTRSVNGVLFSDAGAAGANYVLSGAPTTFGPFGNNVTGSANGLVSDFLYTGDGSGNASLTLNGLTPGQRYITTWYNAAFDPGARNVTIIPSDTNKPYTFNENFSGTGNGNLLRYVFTATSTSITYNFDAVSNGDSFHHYAFSNAVANPALFATADISEATGPGPGFSPYSVRNDDLLQTSVASFTSSGNFNQETSGGLPALRNGSFVINGGNPGDNSPLATGANGSFVEYTLDLSVNTLGYDISSIEAYGGWNDGGRDRQFYRILYSLVGEATFKEIAGLDYDPTGTGNPSAVRAIFGTDLSGVDAIRFEFPTGQENGYAGYGEFDVVGSATVPEPAGAALLVFGSIALVARRRRA
jgi:hypothetical protein